MSILLGFDHMKRLPLIQLITVCAAIAVLGVSCPWQKAAEQPITKKTRTYNVFSQQVKDDYSENIQIKIEDLEIHLGKLREYRVNIAPSSQSTYDTYLSELDASIKDFTAKFEAFKTSPLTEFLPERAKLNEALVKTEDLYLKIITDFKVDFEKKP